MNYYPCGGPEGDNNDEEIKAACENGDVIVAVLGETVSMSGEASSRADITLPGKQKELLEKFLASGKPVVLVLMNGIPLALAAGEENTITFELPKKKMGFWNNQGKYLLEDGLFRIYAGSDSATELSKEIRVGFEGVPGEPDYPVE